MDSKRNGEELVQIFVDADACPVVAMALRKGAYAIHQSGKWYMNDTFDGTGERRQMRNYRCRGTTEAIKT